MLMLCTLSFDYWDVTVCRWDCFRQFWLNVIFNVWLDAICHFTNNSCRHQWELNLQILHLNHWAVATVLFKFVLNILMSCQHIAGMVVQHIQYQIYDWGVRMIGLGELWVRNIQIVHAWFRNCKIVQIDKSRTTYPPVGSI